MKNNSQDDLEKELELIFNWISVWEKKKLGIEKTNTQKNSHSTGSRWRVAKQPKEASITLFRVDRENWTRTKKRWIRQFNVLFSIALFQMKHLSLWEPSFCQTMLISCLRQNKDSSTGIEKKKKKD